MTSLLAIQYLHYTPHTALLVRTKGQSSYTSDAFVFPVRLPLRSLHHRSQNDTCNIIMTEAQLGTARNDVAPSDLGPAEVTAGGNSSVSRRR